MKKSLRLTLIGFLLSLLTISANYSYSQSLQFCEDVSKDGEAIKSSSVFNISTKGGYLKCLLTLPYRVATKSVSYEVYKIDSEGNESYDNTIYQTVDPGWTWFYKDINFSVEGRFNVYVYDADKNFLASGQIRIQYF